MTKKSGLFSYLSLCVSEKSLYNIVAWRHKLVTSTKEAAISGKSAVRNYYLLYNPTPQNEPNPFNTDYIIGGGEPHLTCDEFSYSANSEYLNRRNLSYAHGTEYFVPIKAGFEQQRVITVHYHFNNSGLYLHTTCKDATGKKIEVLPEQEAIFKERAQVYREVLCKLLEQKSNKYAALCEEIENAKNEISANLASAKITKDDLQIKINKYAQLNSLKDSISDKTFDRSTSFNAFVKVVEQILKDQSKKVSSERVNNKEDSAGLNVDVQDIKLVTSASKSTITTSTKIKKESDLSHEIKSIEEQVKQLQSLSKVLDAKSSKEQIVTYIEKFSKLHTILLLLGFNERSVEVSRKTNNLFEQFGALKTPESIFENAIAGLNFPHIQVSFDWCSHLCTYKLFSKIIKRLMNAVMIDNKEEASKIKEVTDFLNENTELFRSFILNVSKRYFIFNFSDGTNCMEWQGSVLGAAFARRNKEVFSAMLSYGAETCIPFAVFNGQIISAVSMMITTDCKDDFYLEELVRYGINFNARSFLNFQQRQKEISKLTPVHAALNKKALKHDLEESLNYLSLEEAIMAPYIENSDNEHQWDLLNFSKLNQKPKDNLFLCKSLARKYPSSIPLMCKLNINLDENFGDNLYLYEALAKHFPLSSLLLSLAYLTYSYGGVVSTIPCSKKGKLIQTNDIKSKFVELVSLGGANVCSNVSCVLVVDKAQDSLIVKKINIIYEAIAKRFALSISQTFFDKTSSEIMLHVTKNQKDNMEMIYSLMAIKFLYSLKGPLSAKEIYFCIETSFTAGMACLKRATIVRDQSYESTKIARNKLTLEELTAFMADFKEIKDYTLARAFDLFEDAIRIAYLSPFESNINEPIVAEAFNKLDYILNECKLHDNFKETQGLRKSTTEQWLANRKHMISWVQQMEEANLASNVLAQASSVETEHSIHDNSAQEASEDKEFKAKLKL